ncbi:hypothetical protein NVV43_12425 [Escherichia marmotae]|uniref:Phage integrase N-terminal domain-containing protein n=1 Tax=Escherichia marmotae TaxID=1499973 RepID=A0AAW5ML05_9ESCH|nr:hypothetical protein [Escherichia marmotae]
MSIKKRPDGKWLVDIRPDGRNGKRVRRLFLLKREAENFIRYTKWPAKKTKPTITIKLAFECYTLHEACEIWWRLVGHTKINAETEKRQLEKTIRQMRNPYIRDVNYEILTVFIASRLHAGNKYISVRRDIYRLSGMFTELVKEGKLDTNPLNKVGVLIKQVSESVVLDWAENAGLKPKGSGK